MKTLLLMLYGLTTFAQKSFVLKYVNNTGITSQIYNTSTYSSLQLWISKSAVGLSMADNTSDLAKPISTAQAAVNASLLTKITSTSVTALQAQITALQDSLNVYKTQILYVKNFSGAGSITDPLTPMPLKMTQIQRLAFTPYAGMQVYQTDGVIGVYGFNQTWKFIF